MNQNENKFIEEIKSAIDKNIFIKLTLSNYTGKEEDLRKILIRRVLVKKKEHLSFTYSFNTKDLVKNFLNQDAIERISHLLEQDFKNAYLFTTEFDLQFQKTLKNKIILKKHKPSSTNQASLEHDIPKKRVINAATKPYLHDLQLTNKEGAVLKNANDKFRQINHYIELLKPLLSHLSALESLKIADMGSGKGYLTFALYDYLIEQLNIPVFMTGVEFRKDLVDLCNSIALRNEFSNLNFIQGSILDFPEKDFNVFIALHACDTATDDAIMKGIEADAALIVVAPCCHKQIRREMEKGKPENDFNFLTKYGIFLERQAEMITDGIRALILNYFGYKTKILDFISDDHTPKNVMIIAEKNPKAIYRNPEILEEIKAVKDNFGIGRHYLEKIYLNKINSSGNLK